MFCPQVLEVCDRWFNSCQGARGARAELVEKLEGCGGGESRTNLNSGGSMAHKIRAGNKD